MATRIPNFDWRLAQSCLAVAETGSLSAAAVRLGLSQPTLGRHIASLEQSLGQELFRRVPRGLVPTEFTQHLLPHLDQMSRAAAAMSLGAAGKKGDLAGTVRLTASVVVSHFVLPPVIAKLRQSYPQIQVELVPSDTSENLIFREADIAVRMYRPTQLDVVAKKIADLEVGLFAATTYLERAGRPRTQDDLFELDFIGFDKSELAIRAMAEMGIKVTRDFFAVRCDDQAAYWQLVRAGCGIGAAQAAIGACDPLVERIFPQLALPTLPMWLTAPEALRSNARIRLVWDFLADHLGP